VELDKKVSDGPVKNPWTVQNRMNRMKKRFERRVSSFRTLFMCCPAFLQLNFPVFFQGIPALNSPIDAQMETERNILLASLICKVLFKFICYNAPRF
jgi:hypothetical protein